MFVFEEIEYGWFQVYVYCFDDEIFIFIVEVFEEVWCVVGLEIMEKEEVIVYCEWFFVKYFDGNKLIFNVMYLWGFVQWICFLCVVCWYWVYINVYGMLVVLMGDVVYMVYFLIGLGIKLVLEDLIELVCSIGQYFGDLCVVFEYYEVVCSVEVLCIQNVVCNLIEWFENVDCYVNLLIE